MRVCVYRRDFAVDTDCVEMHFLTALLGLPFASENRNSRISFLENIRHVDVPVNLRQMIGSPSVLMTVVRRAKLSNLTYVILRTWIRSAIQQKLNDTASIFMSSHVQSSPFLLRRKDT